MGLGDDDDFLDPVEPDDADEDGKNWAGDEEDRHWAEEEPVDEDEGYDDYWDDDDKTDWPEAGDTLMQEIMESNRWQ